MCRSSRWSSGSRSRTVGCCGLRVAGGADAAHRFMQHVVARRLASLEQLLVQFHPAEDTHFVGAVAHHLAVHAQASTGDQHLRVAAAEFGQVGEEAVQAHQSSASGGNSCAQRGQRQARRRSSAGIRSSAAASISVVKHQQAWAALAGSARVQRLDCWHSGQRPGSISLFMARWMAGGCPGCSARRADASIARRAGRFSGERRW